MESTCDATDFNHSCNAGVSKPFYTLTKNQNGCIWFSYYLIPKNNSFVCSMLIIVITYIRVVDIFLNYMRVLWEPTSILLKVTYETVTALESFKLISYSFNDYVYFQINKTNNSQ